MRTLYMHTKIFFSFHVIKFFPRVLLWKRTHDNDKYNKLERNLIIKKMCVCVCVYKYKTHTHLHETRFKKKFHSCYFADIIIFIVIILEYLTHKQSVIISTARTNNTLTLQ